MWLKKKFQKFAFKEKTLGFDKMNMPFFVATLPPPWRLRLYYSYIGVGSERNKILPLKKLWAPLYVLEHHLSLKKLLWAIYLIQATKRGKFIISDASVFFFKSKQPSLLYWITLCTLRSYMLNTWLLFITAPTPGSCSNFFFLFSIQLLRDPNKQTAHSKSKL